MLHDMARGIPRIGFMVGWIVAVVSTLPAVASENEGQLPEWSVRTQPTGNLDFEKAGVFRRISPGFDLGAELWISWSDESSDNDDEWFDDQRTVSETFDKSRSVTIYPELRRWSGIWGENPSLKVRTYWGLRIVAGVAQSRHERSGRNIQTDEVRTFESEDETESWNLGVGVSMGASAHVWGPISFSAAVAPVTLTRSHSRSVGKSIESDPLGGDPRILENEDVYDRTRISFSLEPQLYVVLSW